MMLRQLRKRRGLTLEAVAVLAGCDKGLISKIERGQIPASPDITVRLAKALGLSAFRMRDILAADFEREAVSQ